MTLPKLTVITPSLNQVQFLQETLHSVLNQHYPHLEYIVIDGASTDGSVDVIRNHEHYLAYWISEPDNGQAHAINKGIARATGDIIAFLNSDDLYLPGAFKAVANHFQSHPFCQWLCGDTIVFGDQDPTRLIRAAVPKSAAHCLSWAYKAPQPGMFWKREIMHSGFREQWRYAFDHELYVRLLLAGHKCEHLPLPLAAYRLHSESKTVAEAQGFGKEFDAIAEIHEGHLSRTGRRWSRATRILRHSYHASQAGNVHEAASCVFRAALIHPESMRHRLFWGCLRRLVRSKFRHF
jgi:glycosyltransferase involved in cell wall biosynthesis